MTYQRSAGTVLVSLDLGAVTRDARIVMRDTAGSVHRGDPESALHFTCDHWATFVHDVTHELPVDNPVDEAPIPFARGERAASWRAWDPDTGATTHFDDEWERFGGAAPDGARPVSPPRQWATAISLAAGGCCLVAGTVASVATGAQGWSLVGLAATAVLLGAGVYSRVLRALLRALPRTGGRGPDLVDAPDPGALGLLVLAGVLGVVVAGIVTWATTQDWRWAVTGVAIAAVLPGIALVAIPGMAADILPSAESIFGAVLLLVGAPGVVLGWMWTADTPVLFYGANITVGGALLSLCTATLVASGDG